MLGGDRLVGASSGRRRMAALKLRGQIAAANDAVAVAAVERVLPAPGAQHHLGMVEEIAVDRDIDAIDRKRRGVQPVRIGVIGRLRLFARLRRNTISVTTSCLRA